VVASEIGSLPEKMLVPPRIADELRTGWLARPGDPAEFAAGIAAALTLDAAAYRSLAARAREYAQFGFSPSAVAAATLAVYTSLLEGG
jgi:glycosyltransferase involved in cell wall biosynthesis